MRAASSFVAALLTAVLLWGCVTRTIDAPVGLTSFAVELVAVDPVSANDLPPGCDGSNDLGSAECPRPFVSANAPVQVRVRAVALDRSGAPMVWSGAALVDVRPGGKAYAGGTPLQFIDGESQVLALEIAGASGPTRIWVEDCGSGSNPGSFATGTSAAIYFAAPRIDQLNATTDNRTGALAPRADNACAISGDPRFGIGRDRDGVVGFVGYSHEGAVNAPPPPNGDYVELIGCSRARYDAQLADAQACRSGPLVVTGVDRRGFWVTDVRPGSMAAGFNSIYANTDDYPRDIERGDLLLTLAGTPVERDGTTELDRPTWRRDGIGRARDLQPPPVRIDPVLYRNSFAARSMPPCDGCTFGDDDPRFLALEALEGAVVCVDNLAPASRLVDCDADGDRGIERSGCVVSGLLPPRCEEGTAPFPIAPVCDNAVTQEACLPLSTTEIAACALSNLAPHNALEYCCERICYEQLDCGERSMLERHGAWVADLYGRYERDPLEASPLKIGVVTRDADPQRDPFTFARTQLEVAPQQRQHLRVVGNLRQILSARPVWVVVPRDPDDIRIQEVTGPCPSP